MYFRYFLIDRIRKNITQNSGVASQKNQGVLKSGTLLLYFRSLIKQNH